MKGNKKQAAKWQTAGPWTPLANNPVRLFDDIQSKTHLFFHWQTRSRIDPVINHFSRHATKASCINGPAAKRGIVYKFHEFGSEVSDPINICKCGDSLKCENSPQTTILLDKHLTVNTTGQQHVVSHWAIKWSARVWLAWPGLVSQPGRPGQHSAVSARQIWVANIQTH